MDALLHVSQIVRMKRPGFVLFHDPAIPAEAICAIVCARAGTPVTVARLWSDHICAEDGAFIRDTLLDDRVLLLIAPDAKRLPAELDSAWSQFHGDPRHTYSEAGRFILFSPDDADRERGTLGFILPSSYDGRRLETIARLFIDSLDELGGPAEPVGELRNLGRAAVSLSMKALCFLHHRDPDRAEHHDSVAQIMKGPRRLTWRDLQRLLRQQANQHMFDILEAFGRQGRVSVEQLDLAAEAIAHLLEERGEDERIGGQGVAPSIYHVLWSYSYLEEVGRVFRGQRDSRWRQDTTLLRAEPDGTPATLETIVQRLHRTQAFLDALAADERNLVGRELNDDERLAIAQHYGVPTALLDYTRSLAIAAFFATGAGDPSVLHKGDVGLIYCVSPHEQLAVPAAPETPAGFDLAKAAGLRIGRLTAIEPELPDPENRIARQMGVFVDGFDSRDLQRFSVNVLYFRQGPGEAFEDPRLGITRDRLLAPDSKLQQLAHRIVFDPPKLSKRLTAARLPGDDVFGALGLLLPSNLHKAQRFLDRLADEAERLEPGLWLALRAVLERHLSEARIKARTADVSAQEQLLHERGPAGIRYVLDEVDTALEELAALAGLERNALTSRLRRSRPVLGPDRLQASVNEWVELPSTAPKARIVNAAGLFIVGLEYLRTVHGAMAEQHIQNAEHLLSMPERELGRARLSSRRYGGTSRSRSGVHRATGYFASFRCSDHRGTCCCPRRRARANVLNSTRRHVGDGRRWSAAISARVKPSMTSSTSSFARQA